MYSLIEFLSIFPSQLPNHKINISLQLYMLFKKNPSLLEISCRVFMEKVIWYLYFKLCQEKKNKSKETHKRTLEKNIEANKLSRKLLIKIITIDSLISISFKTSLGFFIFSCPVQSIWDQIENIHLSLKVLLYDTVHIHTHKNTQRVANIS